MCACQLTRVCEEDWSVVCRTLDRSSWSGDVSAEPGSVGSVSCSG